MDWQELTIQTTAEGIEAVCGRLYTLGLENVEIVDDEQEIQAHLDRIRAFWDYVDPAALMQNEAGPKVRAYIENTEAGNALLQSVIDSIDGLRDEDVGLDLGPLTCTARVVNDDDWANNWKQYFKPLPVGERLLITPAWEAPPQTRRTVLTIDPKFLFGTGQHASTRLCLEALEGIVRPGDALLDIGCGSGILSIAALLLGARHATAVDIELGVENAVMENARLNRIEPGRLTILHGDAVASEAVRSRLGEGYPVIVANIVADVILALIDTAYERLEAGGRFVTSGIIDDRAQDVRDALVGRGFMEPEVLEREGWVCLVARKA